MPDFLFDQMKKLYPGASDEDVVKQIQMADAMPTPPKDDSYLPSLSPVPPATPANVPSTDIQGPDTPITAPADPYKDMAIENVRQKYLGDKYGDAARQKLIDDNRSRDVGGAIGAALAGFGSGMAGGNAASTTENLIQGFDKSNQQKLADFDTGRQAQISDLKTGEDLTKYEQDQAKLKREMDPNSAESKIAQDLAVQMGMDPQQAKGLTAAKFKDFSPIMEKKYQVAEQAQARRDVADTAAEARRDNLQMMKLQRSDNVQDKALTSTQQLLESARGNPAAAQAERDLYAADKAKSLANMYGDPNKLSQRQVSLLVAEVGKIAQGGSPTMSELEGLNPDTLRGKLSRWWEKLSNSPTAANAADFVKQYTDYTNVLAKDAQKVINDKYARVIEARKDQLGPKNYQALKDQYLNRFNATAGAPSQGAAGAPDRTEMKTVGGKQYRKVAGGWQEVE